MTILATSDTHGMLDGLYADIKESEADVVVFAGDIAPCTVGSDETEYILGEFYDLAKDLHDVKFVSIPGNHDRWAVGDEGKKIMELAPSNLNWLVDSECSIDGVKFYGSPWVPHINGRWAFESSVPELEADIKERFFAIPQDTNVLITHTPPALPRQTVDVSLRRDGRKSRHFGSRSLLEAYSEKMLHPRLHFCGHIHSGNHIPVTMMAPLFLNDPEKEGATPSCVSHSTALFNASRVNEDYEIAYHPVIVEI